MSNSSTLPDCIICYSSLPEYPVATPCGHIFCKACVLTALNAKRHCPICRKKVSTKHLVSVTSYEIEVSTIDENGEMASQKRLQIKCIKCNDIPKNPELANCGHTFCRSCLQKWRDSDLFCPVHQKPTNRRRFYKLFCAGSDNKTAETLPSLIVSPDCRSLNSGRNNNRIFKSDSESEDNSSNSSTSDSDDEVVPVQEDDIILINEYYLPLPAVRLRSSSSEEVRARGNQRGFHLPNIFHSSSTIFQNFARRPVLLLEQALFPRMSPQNRHRASEEEPRARQQLPEIPIRQQQQRSVFFD